MSSWRSSSFHPFPPPLPPPPPPPLACSVLRFACLDWTSASLSLWNCAFTSCTWVDRQMFTPPTDDPSSGVVLSALSSNNVITPPRPRLPASPLLPCCPLLNLKPGRHSETADWKQSRRTEWSHGFGPLYGINDVIHTSLIQFYNWWSPRATLPAPACRRASPPPPSFSRCLFHRQQSNSSSAETENIVN